MFHYTLDISCAMDGEYFIATELTHPLSWTTNQSIITGSIVHDLITNLTPGIEYHYSTILSDSSGMFLKICNSDLPKGCVF